MTGTEKQIQWAEGIKTQFEAKMWDSVEEANQRVNDGNMPPIWAAAVYDAYQAIRASMDRDIGDKAHMWIEHRIRIMGFAGMVNKLAEKNCPKETRMAALIQWQKEVRAGA